MTEQEQSEAHLANKHQSAHQSLVTERADGQLSLLPGGILHNPARVSRRLMYAANKLLTRIPTSHASRPRQSSDRQNQAS